MTPGEFEELTPTKQKEAIEQYNETERTWSVTCRKCGFRTSGTLEELRGKPCGVCGNG